MSDRDPDRDQTTRGSDDPDHIDERDGAAESERGNEMERANETDGADERDGAEEMAFDDPEDALFEGSDEALFAELDAPGETDPFTEMGTDVETVGDDVFEMVDDDETQPADLDIERDPAVKEVDEGVVVPKRSYCERCPHFSAPPTVGCTNPGTTIHELVDVEHFRVSDCPIVAEQRDVRAPGE